MHIIASLTLGIVLLPIIGDDQMMKNWIDFVKIKFHNGKYWLILHEIRIQNVELNWI
jgi:hypothetical protein